MTTKGEIRKVAPPPGGSRSVARSSVTVGAWTLISRVTGLLRIVVVGAVLGPTFLANTFLATNQVPNLAYSTVAGPVLALVVVPSVVRAMVQHGPAASALHVRRMSGLLVTASSAAALLMMPASLVISWALTAGIPEAERGRARGIAMLLLLLVAPQIVLYVLAALGAAAQQARQQFALAAAAPALENVGLIATMLAVAVVSSSCSAWGRRPRWGCTPPCRRSAPAGRGCPSGPLGAGAAIRRSGRSRPTSSSP